MGHEEHRKPMPRHHHGRLLLTLALAGLFAAPVGAETLNLTTLPDSVVNLTFSLPEVMRSATVSRNIAGTLTENLNFGTVAGFGTVATSGQIQSGNLSLGNTSNVLVDLELLGQVTFSSLSLKLTGTGPSNNYTAPPLAAGKTRVPLTGASLLLNSGTVTAVGTGLVGGEIGTRTFNFATTPLSLPFPAGSYMDVTVSGNTVTQQIPLNLSGVFQQTPLQFAFGLTGTLNLTGTRTTPTVTPVATASLENQQVRLRSATGTWSTFADTGDGLLTPFDVLHDANNNLYVSDVLRSRVTRFNTAGVGTVFADLADGVVSPGGLALDAASNLFVTNYLTNTIAKVNPSGVGSLFADAADGLNSPFGAAVDAAGNLFVANLNSRQILRFTPGGVASVFADSGDGLFTPFDLAFDASGNLYVADILTSRVYRFNSAGVGSVFADAADGLTSPSGLAFDALGNLLVTNYLSNRVISITPAGVGSVYADTTAGLRSPFGISARRATTTTAVPEPGSLVLALLGGAGWLAGRVFRRRQG